MSQKDLSPFITIGITAFEASETIVDAINSAVKQDWPHFEIIIIDDCSKDNTYEIISELSKELQNITVYRNQNNMGVAFSRNRIISLARGDYIAFFDDDDISAPDRLSLQFTRIKEYQEKYAKNAPVICHSARNQIYSDGSIRYQKTMGCGNSIAPNGIAFIQRVLFGYFVKHAYGSCATCSQIASKKTYELVDGFDENFLRSEDTDLNIRLALKGAHFVGIPKPLVTQKMTYGSEKKLDNEKYFFLKLLEKHKNLFPSHRVYHFSLKWIDLKYYFLKKNLFRFLKILIKLSVFHPIQFTKKIINAMQHFSSNLKLSNFYE